MDRGNEEISDWGRLLEAAFDSIRSDALVLTHGAVSLALNTHGGQITRLDVVKREKQLVRKMEVGEIVPEITRLVEIGLSAITDGIVTASVRVGPRGPRLIETATTRFFYPKFDPGPEDLEEEVDVD